MKLVNAKKKGENKAHTRGSVEETKRFLTSKKLTMVGEKKCQKGRKKTPDLGRKVRCRNWQSSYRARGGKAWTRIDQAHFKTQTERSAVSGDRLQPPPFHTGWQTVSRSMKDQRGGQK